MVSYSNRHVHVDPVVEARKVRSRQTPDRPPVKVFQESTSTALKFNVMPDKPVEETLFIKEYRVWDDYVEAVFDREYKSSMEKSPDHLIFLTALVHSQKLLYVWLCHKFGVEYDPHGSERFKMWPTKLDIKIPTLLEQKRDLVHSARIIDIKYRDENTFKVIVDFRVDTFSARVECPVFRN